MQTRTPVHPAQHVHRPTWVPPVPPVQVASQDGLLLKDTPTSFVMFLLTLLAVVWEVGRGS